MKGSPADLAGADRDGRGISETAGDLKVAEACADGWLTESVESLPAVS